MFKRDALLKVIERLWPELSTVRVVADWLTYVEMLRDGKISFSARSLNRHRRHLSSVTHESLDLSQLREIMKVQQRVRSMFDVPQCLVREAISYSDRLFKDFGLAGSDTPNVSRHPELRQFLPNHALAIHEHSTPMERGNSP